MDCNTARMLVTFFGRPGNELAPEDAAALDAHLSACPNCAALVRGERAFDDRVSRAMGAITVPAALKGKLLDGVAAHTGAWYRHKAWTLVGMAATVLLAVGGIIAYQIGTAPVLNPQQIVNQESWQYANRAARIDEVMASQGRRFRPERAFDLSQFSSVGLKEFQGRVVPAVDLTNGPKNAIATIYVVKDTEFNWKKLEEEAGSVPNPQGFQVALVRDRDRNDVAYIVVFTGPGLEVFLEDRSAL